MNEASAKEGLREDPAGRWISIIVLVIIAVTFSLIAWKRNSLWMDGLSIYTDAIAKSPYKLRPHINISMAYRNRDMHVEDLKHWRSSLEKFSDSFRAQSHISIAYLNVGDFNRSLIHMHRAVDIYPKETLSHNHLGNIYMTWNNLDKAFYHYSESIKWDGANLHALPHYNIALIHMKTGRLTDARKELERALEIFPGLTEAREQLNSLNYYSPRAPSR